MGSFSEEKATVIQRLKVIKSLTEAIKSVHDKNYVHNDITFENLMVDLVNCEVTLVDFGYAL